MALRFAEVPLDWGASAPGSDRKSLPLKHLGAKVFTPRTGKALDGASKRGYNRGMKTETIYKNDAFPAVKNTEDFRKFILWGCDGVKDNPDLTARWKFFNPCGAATWYIAEAEDLGDDLRMFGLCDMGMGYPELGYVMLSELASIDGPFGLGIERDIFFDVVPMSEVMS